MKRILVLIGALGLGACHSPDCPIPEDLAWQFSALLTVVDESTGKPIPTPSFSEDGLAISATCYAQTPDPADFAGTICPSWAISQVGDYMLTVSATGYADASVKIANDYTIDGCPAEMQVIATVQLTPG